MKKIWIWISKIWYNQVTENKAKGYITFTKIRVRNNKYDR